MRPSRRTPAELTPGWPEAASDDPEAEAVRLLAVRVRQVAGSASLRQIGEVTGVNFTVVGDVLAGRKWPDVQTLARLEQGLEARLWPTLGPGGYVLAGGRDDVAGGEGPQQ